MVIYQSGFTGANFDMMSRSFLTLFSILMFSTPGFAEELSGTVQVDGSSTVYPLTEAVAEEFSGEHGSVRVPVGVSGTGGGFKKFCSNTVEMIGASRPVKPAESEQCAKQGVTFIDIPIAYDAITIIVHPKNNWISSITLSELKKIWEPAAQGKITRWNHLRPEWPDQPIRLFGPGIDSGTFDYFTEAVVGKEDASRGDYTSSETDDVIVKGVAGDQYALGFLGLAYFEENKSTLKALPVDAEKGKGPQAPTKENVLSGNYAPLSRPLFLYINRKALTRPEVSAFGNFFIKQSAALAEEVGLLPLVEKTYDLVSKRLSDPNAKAPLPTLTPGQDIMEVLTESTKGTSEQK